ncbi:YkvI family membrane protein [Bacillus marinisedimentorum]|uniref:YkvI family membrane protein n=1 Tax=Bacillus marinisedimentorum TaxID=1821260 RepID=UPI0008727B6D|nr:hypothetical protein [Bacillus marinisedimentorum]
MLRAGMKWMFLIMGTMIGAGYASGREIWQFFGHESGLAIILFTFFFIVSCFVIMRISFEKQSHHYLPVLEHLIGKRLTGVYDIMIILYLFTTTVVMLAGSGATLQTFSMPYWTGVLILCLLLVFLFIWEIKGILNMNSVILPLLILGLVGVLLSFILLNGEHWQFDWQHQGNWPSSFTFTALNILPLIAVLSAIGREMKHTGEVYIASIGSGLLLGSVSYLYNQSLLQIQDIMFYEIPLFAVLERYPYFMVIIMSILLWLAIYTTAASGLLGLISRFQNGVNLPSWLLASIVLVLMVPLTSFGFGTLVAVLYPLYGILNLYVMAAILLYPILNHYKT